VFHRTRAYSVFLATPVMIKRILTVSTNASLAAACLMLLLMMAHVTADVVLKWAIHRPVPATLEFVTYYYMAGVVFLPLPAVQFFRQQIMVEVFTHSTPKPIILAIDSVVGVVCAALLGVITYYAYLAAAKATSIGDFVP